MIPWWLFIVIFLQIFQISHIKRSVWVLYSRMIKAATALSPFILYLLRILSSATLLPQLVRMPRSDKLSGLFDFIDFFIHLSISIILIGYHLSLVSPVLQIHVWLILLNWILMIIQNLDWLLRMNELRDLWEVSLLQCWTRWLLSWYWFFSCNLVNTGFGAIHKAWQLLF